MKLFACAINFNLTYDIYCIYIYLYVVLIDIKLILYI